MVMQLKSGSSQGRPDAEAAFIVVGSCGGAGSDVAHNERLSVRTIWASGNCMLAASSCKKFIFLQMTRD